MLQKTIRKKRVGKLTPRKKLVKVSIGACCMMFPFFERTALNTCVFFVKDRAVAVRESA